MGIVPAPGVQILRLVNIESQLTRFEYPGLQASLPGRPQVPGEAIGAEMQLDRVRRGADQRVDPHVVSVRSDRYTRMLQVGCLQ